MTAGAAAEQKRAVAMGERLTEVMEGWQSAQQEWAAAKAELEAERDEALRKAAHATQLLTEAAAQPEEAARLLERLGMESGAAAPSATVQPDKRADTIDMSDGQAAPPAAAKRSIAEKDTDVFPPKAPAKAGRTRRKQDGPPTGLPGADPPMAVE